MIAARPSLGKSSLAVNIAFKTAFVHDKIVGVFTLEMGNYELIYRMLSFAAHVNLGNMMTGKISDHDIETIEDRAKNIMNKNIFIDDSGYNSISEIKAKARRLKAEQKKLDLIIIDYIQLMSAGKSHDNRNSELSEISRGLKILAKDLEIPVIALSQLSRDSDKGGNPRKPRLSDLRDSGALEQDADIVMFLHKSTKDDQLTDLIIAKNRNGPTGEVKLLFIPEYTLFKNAPEADVNAPYINQKNHYWHN
jgi:replicative DNA helicase